MDDIICPRCEAFADREIGGIYCSNDDCSWGIDATEMKVQMDRDLTHDELNEQPEGSVVSMGCPVCEGFEKHEKANGIWRCKNCGL